MATTPNSVTVYLSLLLSAKFTSNETGKTHYQGEVRVYNGPTTGDGQGERVATFSRMALNCDPVLYIEGGLYSPMKIGDPRLHNFIPIVEWAISVLNGSSNEVDALFATLEAHGLANAGQEFTLEISHA